jgi:hypothetical protein
MESVNPPDNLQFFRTATPSPHRAAFFAAQVGFLS